MGKLILVPTPIGNLGDITLRALECLKEADLVLAEDTRVSGKLFKHFSISTPLLAHHQNNEHAQLAKLIVKLQQGETLALITDAGSPGISDPGFLLTRACVDEGISVEALPGPTAFVPALVQSGLPSDRFVFEGFLPPKKGRQSRLNALAEESRTLVLYESPHKLVKTLTHLKETLGADRRISVSRELTKLHEETLRGSLEEMLQHFEKHAPRGEFVLVIEGRGKS
jgi:16S rRNA (cytidine1402-2'-O)-methyltransferase